MMNSSPEFLETADRIGRRLCRDAVWSGNKCTWLGWSTEQLGNGWAPGYRSFAADLYSGTSGIALLLAYLWRYSGDRHQRKALEGALNQALAGIESMRANRLYGFYSGLSGIAWVLSHVGRIIEHDGLVQRGLAEMRSLADLAPDKHFTDVISGSAGTIPALLDMGIRFEDSTLIDIARRHGDNLLDSAEQSGEGWSWNTMPANPEQRNLTGHSHGVAGIVTALLELYAVTADERLRNAAMEGLRYERKHYSEQRANWPDFREFPGTPAQAEPAYSIAWCHGAPGIGMSRLRCYTLMNKADAVLHEIEAALHTTRANLGRGLQAGYGNFSLCHGEGGNADLLILAADILHRPDLREQAEQVGMQGVELIERRNNPWPCGVNNGGETPNLLLGLAGIAWFYLRLYNSAEVPSVLIVQPGKTD